MPRHIQTFHLFSDIGHQRCSELERVLGQDKEMKSCITVQCSHFSLLTYTC